MPASQKMGKCKNLIRSGRDKAHNTSVRNAKVDRSRKRHIKNAEQSCGINFANKLRKHYATIGIAPRKVK